jgi:serine/threonine protein kinase
MPIAPGTRLGPCEVTALIGSGGMGEVYKARDTRLDRSVAIKVLPAHVSADPERRADNAEQEHHALLGGRRVGEVAEVERGAVRL